MGRILRGRTEELNHVNGFWVKSNVFHPGLVRGHICTSKRSFDVWLKQQIGTEN